MPFPLSDPLHFQPAPFTNSGLPVRIFWIWWFPKAISSSMGPHFVGSSALGLFFSSFQNGAFNKQKHDFPKNMSFDYIIFKNIQFHIEFWTPVFFSGIGVFPFFPIKKFESRRFFFPLRPSPMMMNPMMGMMAGMASMATMAKAMAKARSGGFLVDFLDVICGAHAPVSELVVWISFSLKLTACTLKMDGWFRLYGFLLG